MQEPTSPAEGGRHPWPPIGENLTRLRKHAGLTQEELAERAGVSVDLIKRLEQGNRASARLDSLYRLACALDAPLSELLATPPPEPALEVLQRLEASDVSAATLDALQAATDQLCRDYPSRAAADLRRRGHGYLEQVTRLLGGRTALAQHRELLVTAGWLALLVACAEYDLGLADAAEASRVLAARLGQEAGHAEVEAWAWEVAAWMALTRHDPAGAVAAGQAGRRVTATHPVAVQLAAQEAKGYARLGELRAMEAALERAGRLLDRLPRPAHPEHHFTVDPDKLVFYAMDCYRIAGQDAKAAEAAREVLRRGTAPDGTPRWPMRRSQAQLTLGVAAARDGELEAAVAYGVRALAEPRRSLPSLLLVAGELEAELTARYSRERVTGEYLERLRALRVDQ